MKVLCRGVPALADVIDRQLFTFFKKFQLAAIGIVVALLLAIITISEQKDLKSIIGIEQEANADEEIVSFDYSTIFK